MDGYEAISSLESIAAETIDDDDDECESESER